MRWTNRANDEKSVSTEKRFRTFTTRLLKKRTNRAGIYFKLVVTCKSGATDERLNGHCRPGTSLSSHVICCGYLKSCSLQLLAE